MGRVAQEGSDIKSQLVSQICSISTASIGCAHRQYSNSGRSTFIDWYCLLGVEENAGVDVIRKRYHKLDKNKHPKAEIAFKLVSQNLVRTIYDSQQATASHVTCECSNLKWTSCTIKMKGFVCATFKSRGQHIYVNIMWVFASVCLSDNAKRRAFDLQRLQNFCLECNRIPYSNGDSPSNSSPSVPKARNPTAWSRSCRILQSFKDIRERFKEEARVIENCLRINMGSRIESPVFGSPEYLYRSNTQHKTTRETPIFDPSDYLLQGYPHLRTRIYRKPDHCWSLQRGNSLNYERGRRRFDSPIFEIRSDITMSKSACVYS